MLKLTLEAIQILDLIAREGSFAGAAEQLHKVPSTVSYTVAKLEEQLDMLIFDRRGPRVSLTPAGEELLREGRWLVAAARDLESRLRKIAKGFESELTIVHDSIVPTAALAGEVAAFEALACGTRLRICSEVLGGTWEALGDGRADLILAAGEAPLGHNFQTRQVGMLTFGFFVAPDHPLALAVEPLTEADLRGHVAIVVGDSARSVPLRSTGVLSGQRRMVVPDMAAKCAFQEAGLGFGFLPHACARRGLAAGRLVEKAVAQPKSPERFYLAWREEDAGEGLKWWRKRLDRELIPALLEGHAP